MASTARLSPNSDASGSGNSRHYLNREKLRKLLASLPAKKYLLESAIAIWEECGQHEGTQFFFMKSVPDCARRRKVCPRTMRSHLRKLETLFGKCSIHVDGPDPVCQECRSVALLQLHKKANTVRRPATHQLNTEALLRARRREESCLRCGHVHTSESECGSKLESRHSYNRLCRCSEHYGPSVLPITKSSRSESQPRERSVSHHNGKGISRAEDRAQKLRTALVTRRQLYKEGVTVARPPEGGYPIQLRPGDERYVKPMPDWAATLAACNSLVLGDQARGLEPCGLTREQSLELAREVGFDWVPPENGP